VGKFSKVMCWFWHKFDVIKDTGEHHYLRCSRCGAKKIRKMGFGYQPPDYDWLLPEFKDTISPPKMKPPKPPRGGTCAKNDCPSKQPCVAGPPYIVNSGKHETRIKTLENDRSILMDLLMEHTGLSKDVIVKLMIEKMNIKD